MIMQQDPQDFFAIAQFLWATKPDVMLEFGTNTGGSAVVFAQLMTAYNPNAHVITFDVSDNTNKSWTGKKPKVVAPASRLWGTSVRPIVADPSAGATVHKVKKW